MKTSLDRRRFLATTAVASAALSTTSAVSADNDKPALLGGKPVRHDPFPGWPKFDHRDETNLLDVLRSGNWYRGSGDKVDAFEAAVAEVAATTMRLLAELPPRKQPPKTVPPLRRPQVRVRLGA